MTLVRVTLPSVDAQAVVEQPRTGAVIVVEGTQTVSIDVQTDETVVIRITRHAAQYARPTDDGVDMVVKYYEDMRRFRKPAEPKKEEKK